MPIYCLLFLYSYQEKRFVKNLAQEGRFLWNYITIPAPVIPENEYLPNVARKKRRPWPRGRPNPLHVRSNRRGTYVLHKYFYIAFALGSLINGIK